MSESKEDRHISFRMITAAARNQLFGLDKNGKVWKYIPANKEKEHFAFWTRLTDYAPESGR